MRQIFAILVALFVTASVCYADTELEFPNGDTPARLRIEVADGDQLPDVAWAAFLDKLFAYFDRDGDGSLVEVEGKRVFSLPLPDGREVKPDFAAMDANHDGKVTATEFRTYYRARGFTPLTIVIELAPPNVIALGEVLFHHLDRDHDEQLSLAELRQAPALLKRLDENEDEILTAKEILGVDPPMTKVTKTELKLRPITKQPTTLFKLSLNGTPALTKNEQFRLSTHGSQLSVPGGTCSVTVSTIEPTTGFRAAKDFYLAQFLSATGDKPALKSLFADDPTTQVLAGLFDAADRDGDGKLTRAELEAFFELIELGIKCRVIVTLNDRGRNLFDLFDKNTNGELDLGELLMAARTLPAEFTRDKPLSHHAIPASYRLTVSRGPVGNRLGPVPFGTITKPKHQAPPVLRGPKWFQAMDRNGDGFVSAQEFIGSPELFTKFDTNGDGRVSIEEAEATKP